ncbi:MAG: non-homologous end-joining DNA ligase [Actinomycetota bacterium]|nr:non-homologous end-joining DNA ligase [Actinomycetota bacterium]
MGSSGQSIKVGNRKLEVSNLDKVFYPATGFTKGDSIDYYRSISEILLPHLKGRAVTLKRYPNGVTGSFFYEKACPKHRPSWIKTVALRRRDGKDVNYCQLNSEAALAWAANLANLELHVSLASARATHKPQSAVFDLDPGEGTGVLECAGVALRLREMFATSDLDCVIKTSGSKGLQLYVPLNTPASYEDTNRWAKAVAQQLESETPDEVVSTVAKEARIGRVFIDWSQNSVARTTVCVYSLRAMEEPTASTPLSWEEVTSAHDEGDPDRLRFTYDQVLSRVERHGDLFEPVRTLKQRLPRLD